MKNQESGIRNGNEESGMPREVADQTWWGWVLIGLSAITYLAILIVSLWTVVMVVLGRFGFVSIK